MISRTTEPVRLIKVFLLMTFFISRGLYAKEKIEIPINVGIGPAVFNFTGALSDNQPLHYGVALDIAAVIDKAAIKKHKSKIPRKYRRMASRLGEARIGYALIPHSLFISPLTQDTQIYGATWRPLSVNLPLLKKGLKVSVGSGIILTYAFIDTVAGDTHSASTTHFLRPGLELRATMKVALSKSWILSLGWSSNFYPPQELQGLLPPNGNADEELWHIVQGNLVVHYRFPFKTTL